MCAKEGKVDLDKIATSFCWDGVSDLCENLEMKFLKLCFLFCQSFFCQLNLNLSMCLSVVVQLHPKQFYSSRSLSMVLYGQSNIVRGPRGVQMHPPTILRAGCFCDLKDHMLKIKDVNKKKVGSHPLKLMKIQNGRHATNLKICGS